LEPFYDKIKELKRAGGENPFKVLNDADGNCIVLTHSKKTSESMEFGYRFGPESDM
jgi:hypothetical protein